jgi:hypothetical protein
MKKVLCTSIVLMLISSNINFAQEFNGYKYIVVSNLKNTSGEYIKDNSEISKKVSDYFIKKNMIVIKGLNTEKPRELQYNPCLGLYVYIEKWEKWLNLEFYNCKKEKIKTIGGWKEIQEWKDNKIFEELDQNPTYTYDEKLTPFFEYPKVENINKTENELKAYFDSTKTDDIEGIYKTYQSNPNYKLGIFKDGDLYKAIIIESELLHWKKGDVKVIFESTAAEGVFSTKYFMGNKTSKETFSNLEGGLISIEYKNENENENTNINIKLLRLYPKK